MLLTQPAFPGGSMYDRGTAVVTFLWGKCLKQKRLLTAVSCHLLPFPSGAPSVSHSVRWDSQSPLASSSEQSSLCGSPSLLASNGPAEKWPSWQEPARCCLSLSSHLTNWPQAPSEQQGSEPRLEFIFDSPAPARPRKQDVFTP